jgi:hypothetical protein
MGSRKVYVIPNLAIRYSRRSVLPEEFIKRNSSIDLTIFPIVTLIFKDKNRMHKRLMCALGNSHTHKLTNYRSIITMLIT